MRRSPACRPRRRRCPRAGRGAGRGEGRVKAPARAARRRGDAAPWPHHADWLATSPSTTLRRDEIDGSEDIEKKGRSGRAKRGKGRDGDRGEGGGEGSEKDGRWRPSNVGISSNLDSIEQILRKKLDQPAEGAAGRGRVPRGGGGEGGRTGPGNRKMGFTRIRVITALFVPNQPRLTDLRRVSADWPGSVRTGLGPALIH